MNASAERRETKTSTIATIFTFDDFVTELKQVGKKDAELLEAEAEEKQAAAVSSSTRPPPPSSSTCAHLRRNKLPMGLAGRPQHRSRRTGIPAPQGEAPKPPQRVRLVVDERASAAVERPVVLSSSAGMAAEAERRRLSLPTQVGGDALDDPIKSARWKVARFVTPPKGRGIPPCWGAERFATRRLLLHVLRTGAGPLPRARVGSGCVGSVSIMSALSLVPRDELIPLLGAMRLEGEKGQPLLLVLASETADVFRVSVVQGHRIAYGTVAL